MSEQASKFVVCLWGETAFSGETGYLAVQWVYCTLQQAVQTYRWPQHRASQGCVFPSRELTTASSHEFMCLLPTTLCIRDNLV
jgi:hypothetical protein